MNSKFHADSFRHVHAESMPDAFIIWYTQILVRCFRMPSAAGSGRGRTVPPIFFRMNGRRAILSEIEVSLSDR